MDVQEVMAELKSLGSESIKKILLKHGVKEPFFGVKVEYLKNIQKKTKTDYPLAKELYATGNADAMYLAGLITDDSKMTKMELQTWALHAVSNNISEYTVPWVAAGSNYGWELSLEWIKSDEEHIAATGWSTLSNLIALKPDTELDIPAVNELMQRVGQTIHLSPNRVRQTMNSFIIATANYVSSLTDDAITVAEKIGVVTVEMNGTACKVPDAASCIAKMKDRGQIGKKKKTVKC